MENRQENYLEESENALENPLLSGKGKDKISIYPTKDGSYTLRNPFLNDTYHSRDGAVSEALHVYVGAGLAHTLTQKHQIRLLEVGFGTGLNALMSLQYVQNFVQNQIENLGENAKEEIISDFSVHYVGLEPAPLDYKLVKELGYIEKTNAQNLETHFRMMHECENGAEIELSEQFFFQKKQTKLANFSTKNPFDLVYFDAFAPKIQPELWNIEALAHLHEQMSTQGVMVTYCAKGQFKRDLRAIGFEVERLPAPKGRQEMTRAIKI